MKTALITGITGQDGSYLAEFLLSKDYVVHGIIRRSSSINTARINHIYEHPQKENRNLILHYGDLVDQSSLTNLINSVQPDEIYNLGAQSHVAVSFDIPEYTSDVNALGALRILDAIKSLNLIKKTKYYQASSSELYGLVQETPQTEKTPFYPRSPYAVAKLYAYWITVNYREAYGLHASNGILFNHESPRRGETFVTKKITKGLARIFCGLQECLYLGNLDALRDWGHAKDYVEMQWLILQQDRASDYVISSGKQSSVREFIQLSAHHLGIELEFSGSDKNEIGKIASINSGDTNLKPGDIIVRIDEKYFRPSEVDTLLGSSKKAHETLGWNPKINLDQLCSEMIRYDLQEAKKEVLLKAN